MIDEKPQRGDRRPDVTGRPDVTRRARPTPERAAAAAVLARAPAGADDVAARLRTATRRATAAALSAGPGGRPVPGSAVSGAAATAVANPSPRPVPLEAPKPRHLKVVPPAGRSAAARQRRARARLGLAIGMAGVVGLALVYFHVVLAQRQFALDGLQSQVAAAQMSYQEERLKVAQLGSPGQIIATAQGQLGMVQPKKITYLSPGPTTGTATAPPVADVTPLGQAPSASPIPASQAPAGDADWPKIKSQLGVRP